jgi:hypothetical protein
MECWSIAFKSHYSITPAWKGNPQIRMKPGDRFEFPSQALRECTRVGAEEFLNKTGGRFPLEVRFTFYPSPEDCPDPLKRKTGLPGFPERVGRDLVFHLAEEAIRGWPLPAVKGWIQREAAGMQLRMELGPAPFNFRKQILPLFPVSGSAVNIIRQIVEQLKGALDDLLTTRILLDLGLVEPQFHFYEFRLGAPAQDPGPYQDTLPHGWIRASFLGGRLRDFLVLSLLAGQGQVGKRLKSRWWGCYAFFIREDQALLEELAQAILGSSRRPYPELLAGMFIRVRDALLLRRPGPPYSSALH